MNKSFLAATFAGATLLSGCRIESALNPTDPVTLTGSILSEDASPLTGDVKLYRDSTSTCILPGEWATLTADGQGGFTKSLVGADTQAGDVARCFRAVSPLSTKGAAVRAEFLMQVKEVEMPPMQRWAGKIVASAASGAAEQVTFETLTTAQSRFTAASHSASFTSGGVAFWRVDSVTSPVTVDAYVLEDFAAPTAALTARSELKGSGTTFHFTHFSDQVALPPRTLVPASRGATCAYNKAPTVCPLTDGKLGSPGFEMVSDISLTLPQAKVIRHVVLRNLSASGDAALTLEGSNDGTQFTKLTDLSPIADFQKKELPAGGAAYSIYRLRLTGQNEPRSFIGLGELSLFE